MPGLDEAEDLVVLAALAQAGVGIGEDPGVGVAGEEGENALLAPAALRDVVLLDERVVAVIGDRVEVEVEGPPAAELDPEAADGGLPAFHHVGAAARVHAARILGERGALGNDVEAGEEGETRIEGLGHDLGRASDAPQLEREQGAQGVAGGDHAASRQAAVGGEGVDADPGEIGGEQEQAAEVGAQAPGREVERAPVGDGGGLGLNGPAALVGRAPPQLGQPGLPDDPRHGGLADRDPLLAGEKVGDLRRREVPFLAQPDDPRIAVGSRPRPAPAAPVRQEEGLVGLPEEGGPQVPEGSGRIAEASGGLVDGEAVDEERAQGLVFPVRAVLGLEEAVRGALHRGGLCTHICLLA